jgi:hypothetical protein
VENTKRGTLQSTVKDHVTDGTSVYTDSHSGYTGLNRWYAHETVDHAEAYVNGRAHTNGLENFWSLLKRAERHLRQRRAVPPVPLSGDERLFAYNLRELSDLGRFATVLAAVSGRRVTYAELIGQR